MRIAPLLFGLVLLVSCGTDDDVPDGPDTAFACDCPAVTAADVAYDNVGSGLSGGDVQDAVDELAARPEAPADAYGRITIVEDTVVADSAGGWSSQVVCPTTSPTRYAIALGGACDGGDADTVLRGMFLQRRGYRCDWQYSGTGLITLKAQVTCLAQPGD